MRFEEALKLLKQGKRVIAKKDKDAYDQLWLGLDEEGSIIYMNQKWNPSPDWLLDYLNDEWINIEEDCDYNDCLNNHRNQPKD